MVLWSPTVTPSLLCKRPAFLLTERALLPYGRCIFLFLMMLTCL